ncbi:MAG: biotin/lipoyl-containing protein [Myxococcota bacterium]
MSSRRHSQELEARLRREKQDGELRLILGAPRVGFYRDAPAAGSLVTPHQSIGSLEVLGTRIALRAPAGARGAVLRVEDEVLARRPVAYGAPLLFLDPNVQGAVAAELEGDGANEDGLVFPAPSAGRYYGRPAPDAEPFVTVGSTIRTGDTVALLEVMKTFNRVQFGGPGLPASAKVVAIVKEDDSDVARGEALLRLEEE